MPGFDLRPQRELEKGGGLPLEPPPFDAGFRITPVHRQYLNFAIERSGFFRVHEYNRHLLKTTREPKRLNQRMDWSIKTIRDLERAGWLISTGNSEYYLNPLAVDFLAELDRRKKPPFELGKRHRTLLGLHENSVVTLEAIRTAMIKGNPKEQERQEKMLKGMLRKLRDAEYLQSEKRGVYRLTEKALAVLEQPEPERQPRQKTPRPQGLTLTQFDTELLTFVSKDADAVARLYLAPHNLKTESLTKSITPIDRNDPEAMPPKVDLQRSGNNDKEVNISKCITFDERCECKEASYPIRDMELQKNIEPSRNVADNTAVMERLRFRMSQLSRRDENEDKVRAINTAIPKQQERTHRETESRTKDVLISTEYASTEITPQKSRRTFSRQIDEKRTLKPSSIAANRINEAPTVKLKPAIREIKNRLLVNDQFTPSPSYSSPWERMIKRAATLERNGLIVNGVLRNSIALRLELKKKAKEEGLQLSPDMLAPEQQQLLKDMRQFEALTMPQVAEFIYGNDTTLAIIDINDLLNKKILLYDEQHKLLMLNKSGLILSRMLTENELRYKPKTLSRPEEIEHDLMIYPAYKALEKQILADGGEIIALKSDKQLRREKALEEDMSGKLPDLRVIYLDKDGIENQRDLEIDVGYDERTIAAKIESFLSGGGQGSAANAGNTLTWVVNSVHQANKVAKCLRSAKMERKSPKAKKIELFIMGEDGKTKKVMW